MAQSDQVAPGPGPKLTCSAPRRRAGGRALILGWPSLCGFVFSKLSVFSAPPRCTLRLSVILFFPYPLSPYRRICFERPMR
jgi:hypothetical protein